MNATPTRVFELLVLDDDPAIVRLVCAALSGGLEGSVRITGLTDPAEAQRWLETNCCDILVSDIEMPGVDGLEMLRFAKQRNAWTQVIFLTAHSTCDRISEAIENGATDYLLKPIDREDLLRLVAQTVARLTRWQQALWGTMRATHHPQERTANPATGILQGTR